MLKVAHSIITSGSPSVCQAVSLLSVVSALRHPFAAAVFCRAKSKLPVNIWLRNLRGEDICVNDALVNASGRPANWFIGKRYDNSGLDPLLVTERLKTDLIILSRREAVVVREQSRFGLVDTFNAPLISNGLLQGTLHLSIPLDSSECLQSHKSCLDKFGGALQ